MIPIFLVLFIVSLAVLVGRFLKLGVQHRPVPQATREQLEGELSQLEDELESLDKEIGHVLEFAAITAQDEAVWSDSSLAKVLFFERCAKRIDDCSYLKGCVESKIARVRSELCMMAA